MSISIDIKKLKADLQLDEGKKQFPYKDTAGKITIGIGRNLTDVGLSDDEIYYLLGNDIDVAIAHIGVHLPWLEDAPEGVQRAIVNMVFNMGIGGVMGFPIALGLLKDKKYPAAADEFLKSEWAKQVKGRAKRVTDLIRNA